MSWNVHDDHSGALHLSVGEHEVFVGAPGGEKCRRLGTYVTGEVGLARVAYMVVHPIDLAEVNGLTNHVQDETVPLLDSVRRVEDSWPTNRFLPGHLHEVLDDIGASDHDGCMVLHHLVQSSSVEGCFFRCFQVAALALTRCEDTVLPWPQSEGLVFGLLAIVAGLFVGALLHLQVTRAHVAPLSESDGFLGLNVHLDVKPVSVAALLDAPDGILELFQKSWRKDIVLFDADHRKG